LLANIYLHVLDMYWAERYASLGKLVRYADDFVIVCRGKRAAKQLNAKPLGGPKPLLFHNLLY